MEQLRRIRNRTDRAIRYALGDIHAGQIMRHMHIRRAFRSYGLEGARVLDAGCGNGRYAYWIARRCAGTLVRAFDAELDVSHPPGDREHVPNVLSEKMGIEELDADREHDLVYCIEVLEHIPAPRDAVARLVRATKPGGRILIHSPTVHQRRHFRRFDDWDNEDHMVEGYRREDFEGYLRDLGVEITRSGYTAGWFGSLAWELYQMAVAKRHGLAYVLLPVSVALCAIDLVRPNPWGNNFIIEGVRRRDAGAA